MSSWDDGGSRCDINMDICDDLEPVFCDQSLTSNPLSQCDPLVSSSALPMHQEPLTSAIPTPGEPNLTIMNPLDKVLLSSLWSEEFRQNIYNILCDHGTNLFSKLQEALHDRTFVPDGMILPPPPNELVDGAAEKDVHPGTRYSLIIFTLPATSYLLDVLGQSEIPVKELQMNVPADSLYYPWPLKSVGHCILVLSSLTFDHI